MATLQYRIFVFIFQLRCLKRKQKEVAQLSQKQMTLKFELKEGVLDKIAYDVQAEPDLDLEVPYKLTFTKYSGFELGYSHTLRLSKETCK